MPPRRTIRECNALRANDHRQLSIRAWSSAAHSFAWRKWFGEATGSCPCEDMCKASPMPLSSWPPWLGEVTADYPEILVNAASTTRNVLNASRRAHAANSAGTISISHIHAARLSTARLSLLPLTLSHAEEMSGVLADPDLYRFIGGEPPSVADLRDRYRRLLEGATAADELWLNWVIELVGDGRLVGTTQATVSLRRRRLVASVAWIVGESWQGNGYAKEAAVAVVEWLRSLPVAEVRASIHPDHLASSAVAAACGLGPTNEFEKDERIWRLYTRGR